MAQFNIDTINCNTLNATTINGGGSESEGIYYAPSSVYATIQDAIDAAHAANPSIPCYIYVYEGTYAEDLTLYDNIVICGINYASDSQNSTGLYTVNLNGLHTIVQNTASAMNNVGFIGCNMYNSSNNEIIDVIADTVTGAAGNLKLSFVSCNLVAGGNNLILSSLTSPTTSIPLTINITQCNISATAATTIFAIDSSSGGVSQTIQFADSRISGNAGSTAYDEYLYGSTTIQMYYCTCINWPAFDVQNSAALIFNANLCLINGGWGSTKKIMWARNGGSIARFQANNTNFANPFPVFTGSINHVDYSSNTNTTSFFTMGNCELLGVTSVPGASTIPGFYVVLGIQEHTVSVRCNWGENYFSCVHRNNTQASIKPAYSWYLTADALLSSASIATLLTSFAIGSGFQVKYLADYYNKDVTGTTSLWGNASNLVSSDGSSLTKISGSDIVNVIKNNTNTFDVSSSATNLLFRFTPSNTNTNNVICKVQLEMTN